MDPATCMLVVLHRMLVLLAIPSMVFPSWTFFLMVVSCDKLIGVILLDMSSMHVSFLLSRFVKTSESRFGLQRSDGVERTSRMGTRSPCWYFNVLVVGWYFSANRVNCSLAGSNTSALLGWIFQCDHSELVFVYLFCFELTWGSYKSYLGLVALPWASALCRVKEIRVERVVGMRNF